MFERRTTLDSDYDLYHDESQIAGYWHGVLFVPRHSRQRLLDHLKLIRDNNEESDPISLKRLKHHTGPLARCTVSWIQTASVALRHKLTGKPSFLPTGMPGRRSQYIPLVEPIAARFVLFRITTPLNLLFGADHAAKVERTLAMGIKGGLSLFANQGARINVRSMHFDGFKHYGRHVDGQRIVRNIRTQPDRIDISDDFLLDDRTSDHREPNCQPLDDCLLLQLTDLLVSGFRTVLAEAMCVAQFQASQPFAELANKWNRGKKGFENSRWHGGFCISEASLAEGKWRFKPITPPVLGTQHPLFRTDEMLRNGEEGAA